MNPNMMNRNVCYYGANRNRANNCNTDNCNTGNCNTGNCNTGNCNAGNRSAGNCNANNCNTSNRSAGNCSTGNCNTSNCNTGSRNTNNCNTDRCNMPMQERNGNTNCGRTNRENMACNNYMEVDCRQLECMNQQQLLNYLNQVSFSMYDTTLFLDTHPCNREAMAYFNKMQHARKHALEIYEKKFGPLLLDNVDADCEWTWGMQPLPWEPMC